MTVSLVRIFDSLDDMVCHEKCVHYILCTGRSSNKIEATHSIIGREACLVDIISVHHKNKLQEGEVLSPDEYHLTYLPHLPSLVCSFNVL